MTMLSQSSICTAAQKPWSGIGMTPGGSVLKPQGRFTKLKGFRGSHAG